MKVIPMEVNQRNRLKTSYPVIKSLLKTNDSSSDETSKKSTDYIEIALWFTREIQREHVRAYNTFTK